MSAREVTLSKALSRLLRHAARDDGVPISSNGWVSVHDALAWTNWKSGRGSAAFDEAAVQSVVANNEKQRFSLRQGTRGLDVRANQGHSMSGITVDMVLLTAATTPAHAVHGTYFKSWEAIRKVGLSKMARQHIHLAKALPGESGVISGMRASCQLLVWVDVHAAIAAGIDFYESSNGVILTEGVNGVVSPQFFHSVLDRKTGASVSFAVNTGAAATSASTCQETSAQGHPSQVRPEGKEVGHGSRGRGRTDEEIAAMREKRAATRASVEGATAAAPSAPSAARRPTFQERM